MQNKENSIAKDTFVLAVITIVATLLLGVANQLTRGPIAEQKVSTKTKIYQKVYPEAADFEYSDDLNSFAAQQIESLSDHGKDFGKVEIQEMAIAKDSSGKDIGYVLSSVSKEGYGGDIVVAVGVSQDGTVTGVDMLEINETAGLGLQAKNEGKSGRKSFKEQYAGRKVDEFKVTKDAVESKEDGDSATGVSDNDQIQAISGATITSKAVTNAVNAAVYTAHAAEEAK